MKSRFFLILFLSVLLCGNDLFAQFDTESVDSVENQILYNRSTTYGIIFNNLGFGVEYRTGKRRSIFNTRMLEFDFMYYRAIKQVKLLRPYQNSKKYIFGKQNEVFFLRGGVAWKKLLNRRPYWIGGVEVRLTYAGGFSLGIAKPYYLYVIYETNDGESYEIRPQVYNADPAKRDWLDEYGRAPFSKGLNEITIHPGAYFKMGLNFEFGSVSTRMKVLEVGTTIDALPFGMTVMAFSEDQIFFPQFYISLSWGKRFNKY
jgi:hypothetical protein